MSRSRYCASRRVEAILACWQVSFISKPNWLWCHFFVYRTFNGSSLTLTACSRLNTQANHVWTAAHYTCTTALNQHAKPLFILVQNQNKHVIYEYSQILFQFGAASWIIVLHTHDLYTQISCGILRNAVAARLYQQIVCRRPNTDTAVGNRVGAHCAFAKWHVS